MVDYGLYTLGVESQTFSIVRTIILVGHAPSFSVLLAKTPHTGFVRKRRETERPH